MDPVGLGQRVFWIYVFWVSDSWLGPSSNADRAYGESLVELVAFSWMAAIWSVVKPYCRKVMSKPETSKQDIGSPSLGTASTVVVVPK